MSERSRLESPLTTSRDAKLRGFGVRVLPSGTRRFFIHTQHQGERIWKIVGDANSMTIDEARTRAATLLAEIRGPTDTPVSPEDTRFEAVAEVVFHRHEHVWKPGTLAVNRVYLRRQILPAFSGRHIAEITRSDVQRWFASLRATPVAADRSMPILSVILKEAELMGYRPEGSNPCRGIRRYRRKGRERFLSNEEIRRVAARLAAHEVDWPLEVAAIRLLMLTGCRKSEIVSLRWSDYRAGHYVPARQQDRSANRLAVPGSPRDPGGVSLAPAPGCSRFGRETSRGAAIGSTPSGAACASRRTCC